MKKIFFILLSCLFNTSLKALAQIYNPIQRDFRPLMEIGPTDERSTEWSWAIKEKYAMVRVKIFPHNSSYNSPHGKDTVIDRINLSSAGDCKIYKSDYPTSEHEIQRENMLATGKDFEFKVETLTYPIWVECSQAIEVTRSDFLSKPVKYQGLLFIKKVNIQSPYLTVVNVLPFEDYLKGVVPSEMPASWSKEALKAQAIAARTYAYYELVTDVVRHDQNILIEGSGAQIDDTVTYQAYLGLKNTTIPTNKAIEETAGRILTYNNNIIKAFFHADSGGHTENAENIWGVFHPSILAKKEIYPEGVIPGTHWSLNTKVQDIESKLAKAGVLNQEEKLETLFVDNEDLLPSGRPRFVGLKLESGISKKMEAVNFAYITKLKSSWLNFDISDNLQNVIISGRGFGHGAGMNQWGARIMADSLKMNYEDILKFYYTGVRIQN